MSALNFDVIIIGSGAGGGTLAYHLAPSGKRILMLERGDYLPREKDNWNARAVILEAKYRNSEAWLDKDGNEFLPGQHYYVGGNTKFYGAALLRMRQKDFGEIRHHGGISPAWPLSYEDFEPYYTQAEKVYQVHGERGIDPTEPPASGPFPYPPISNEPQIEELAERLRNIGLTPFPLPEGIMINESEMHKSACIRCNTCDGFPCMVNAKDAHITCVEPALQYPNVTLLTNAKVLRLETSPSGREVTGVVVERAGKTEMFSADIVVSSCGAINSAALLLRSANDKHPNGLANSSDVVGRHYMCHNNSALIVVSKKPNPTKFQKTLGINDFYFGSDEWEYPMGHMQMLGKTSANMFKRDAKLIPGMVLDKMAKHSLDLWFTSEDLPHYDNRVTIDSNGNIVLRYTENNTEAHKRLIAKFKGMLEKLGCEKKHMIPHSLYMGKKIPIAGVGHQNGTIRFGHDPKTSALDRNCKAHDLDNLYVVDSSFFVSSSACNPTLTIAANAIRVGDHLLERLK